MHTKKSLFMKLLVSQITYITNSPDTAIVQQLYIVTGQVFQQNTGMFSNMSLAENVHLPKTSYCDVKSAK